MPVLTAENSHSSCDISAFRDTLRRAKWQMKQTFVYPIHASGDPSIISLISNGGTRKKKRKYPNRSILHSIRMNCISINEQFLIVHSLLILLFVERNSREICPSSSSIVVHFFVQLLITRILPVLYYLNRIIRRPPFLIFPLSLFFAPRLKRRVQDISFPK